MLTVGQAAPDFEATTTQGTAFRLEAARGKPVILYFFPKAFTGG